MAVPRHKLSKAKKRQRRAHHARTPSNHAACPRCNAAKLPHRVCSNCGFYKGEQKIAVEEF